MNRQQLPHDPDPLEVEPEPVRRDRRQADDSDPLGLFAIFLAVLVLLAIVAAASLVGWDLPTTP